MCVWGIGWLLNESRKTVPGHNIPTVSNGLKLFENDMVVLDAVLKGFVIIVLQTANIIT